MMQAEWMGEGVVRAGGKMKVGEAGWRICCGGVWWGFSGRWGVWGGW